MRRRTIPVDLVSNKGNDPTPCKRRPLPRACPPAATNPLSNHLKNPQPVSTITRSANKYFIIIGFTPEYFKSEEAKKYDWSQVYEFTLPAGGQYDTTFENEDEFDSSNSAFWDLDDRLIDYDMLVAEPEEADRIYRQLKERAMRRAAVSAKERRIG